jgi:formylglycine-generating enzyme required for sulfatase activity
MQPAHAVTIPRNFTVSEFEITFSEWDACVAGLPQVRVHDLKHTFGRRLRAAGVSFEDRQDLLGHRSGRITTHYSAAELSRLIEAANSVCDRDGRLPERVVLRGVLRSASRKTPANDSAAFREIQQGLEIVGSGRRT